MSKHVNVVVIPGASATGLETLAYDVLKLDPLVAARIFHLTGERSWEEVVYGDVKGDAKACRDRAASLKDALVPLCPHGGIPEGCLVERVRVYPASASASASTSAQLPKVVVLNVAYGRNVPSKELYYYDKLPAVVLDRLSSLKSKRYPSQEEEDLLEVLYGDLERPDPADRSVETDYLPGNEHLLSVKTARHNARDAPRMARERLLEEAAVKETVEWVKGVPQGFDVVLERSYVCG
jgi:hypothetical protein